MFSDESVDWSALDDVKEGHELCKPFMTQFGGHWVLQVENENDKLAFGQESDSLQISFCPNEHMFYIRKFQEQFLWRFYECRISDLNVEDAKHWIANDMTENKYC